MDPIDYPEDDPWFVTLQLWGVEAAARRVLRTRVTVTHKMECRILG